MLGGSVISGKSLVVEAANEGRGAGGQVGSLVVCFGVEHLSVVARCMKRAMWKTVNTLDELAKDDE